MTKLSLCMIVRDNEHTLSTCLAGIRPWVDEMIVVDTGSIDRTPDIVREFGAQLHHFKWCDDFSAARNVSLSQATGEWIFWMDSDDTIDEENGLRLRELADGVHDPSVLGYVLQVRCPGPTASEETVVDHVKLVRNHPELRFEFRIHEQLLPSIRRLGGNVDWTDIFVVHSGADHSSEGRQRKYDRDLRILAEERRHYGDHPFVLFNLGMTYADMEDPERAIECLIRCIEVSEPTESHLRKAYAILIGALLQQTKRDEAIRYCEEGRSLFPNDRELLFRLGMVRHELGDLPGAVEAYREVFSVQEDRHFSSVDPGVYGHKARHNLAVVYRDAGRPDLAEVQWRMAASERPSYKPIRHAFTRLLISQGKFTTAEIEIEAINSNCDVSLLRAELLEAKGDLKRAHQEFSEAVAARPEALEVLESRARFLFHHGTDDEAERALAALIKRLPNDAASHSNLGAIYLRRKNWPKAIACLEESLRLRPNSAATLLQLGNALANTGEINEARESWQRAAQYEPLDSPLRSSIDEALAAARNQ